MKTRNVQPSQDAVPALNRVRRRIECEFSELRAEQPQILRLALNEAEAIAEETGFAELVFPTLAEEKAHALAEWTRRQKEIQRDSSILWFTA
jgi:hypothetical protein